MREIEVTVKVNHFFARLVEIGRSESFDELGALSIVQDQSAFWNFVGTEHDSIRAFADQLSQADLVAFAKALTVAEDRAYGGYASVSPVIDLYRKIDDPDRTVADWILKHTHNEYLPFGGGRLRWNRGAKSIAEYDRIIQSIAKERNAAVSKDLERQERENARIAQEATQKLFGAVRRSDINAVVTLLAKGADVNATNGDGKTVIALATEKRNQAILSLLTERQSR